VDSQFWKVFLLGAIFLVPAIFLVFFSLKTFHDPYYVDISYRHAFHNLKKEPNIRNTMIIHFLLRFFYMWYAIYIPIYLSTEIGFSFDQILGIIIPITIVPFILLSYPLGKLADKRHIERELIILGFVILAFATILIAFVNSESIIVWTAVLLLGRIGAAFVEVMVSTLFYKQIEARHVNLISIYRTLRPASNIVAPLFATILLAVFGVTYQYIFLFLGLILLLGIPISYALRHEKDYVIE